MLFPCRRQYVASGKREQGLVTEIIQCKKSHFQHEAAYMLFNQSQGKTAGGTLTSSALIISVADIWDYIMNRYSMIRNQVEAKETHINQEMDKPSSQCPRCGRPLKKMRCRIDEAELYCTYCGHSFDARRLKGKTGK